MIYTIYILMVAIVLSTTPFVSLASSENNEIVASVASASEAEEIVIQNRWNISVSEEEQDLLERIVMLESGGEVDRGQQAVAEVILNRVYSEKYPDTVYEVLSQVDSGYVQFSTWKKRNLKAADPSERVIQNVAAVLNGETDILPFETVLFSRKAQNRNIQEVIGNHVFCNR